MHKSVGFIGVIRDFSNCFLGRLRGICRQRESNISLSRHSERSEESSLDILPWTLVSSTRVTEVKKMDCFGRASLAMTAEKSNNTSPHRHSERSEESSCILPRHSEALAEESSLDILPWTLVSSTRVTTRDSNDTPRNATTHRHCESITNRQSNPSFTQSGRSMIEMLGVLAVVAVLTIGGITGYNYAVNKYKSNTIMKDLELRAVALSAQIERMMPPLTPGLELSNDAPKTNPLGQPVTQFISANNVDYFEIEVQKVTQKTCVQTVKDYPSASLIFVNDVSFKGNTDVCTEGDNVMTFVFPKYLGGRAPCSDKGFFDESSYACKCSGNTYFNPETNDCACPAGYVWSNTGRTCIQTKCLEGMFEDVSGKCIECEDPAVYTIANKAAAIALCDACPNRERYQPLVCSPKCEAGISFTVSGGTCVPCITSGTMWMNKLFRRNVELCDACPNRYTTYGVDSVFGHCVSKTVCQTGKTFLVAWLDGGTTCRPCDTPDTFWIGKAVQDQAFCNACTNAAGVKNRQVKGDYCTKVVCDANEFKGADGVCYACTEPKKIAVGDNSGCEITSCGRTVVDGLCQIKDCIPGDFISIDRKGECYACDTEELFNSRQNECEGHCTKVERRWTEWGGGLCKLNKCKKGVNYPYFGNNNTCYACSLSAAGSGGSDWGREYCEACGNYVVETLCINPNTCNKGTEFRRVSTKLCTPCDTMENVGIGDHPLQRDMCNACTSTKRFTANNVCLRCDISSSPTLVTEADKDSCVACGTRELVGNVCKLRQ